MPTSDAPRRGRAFRVVTVTSALSTRAFAFSASLAPASAFSFAWAFPLVCAFALASAFACAAPSTAESPGLGVAVDDTRLAAIAITVMPDGTGLPAGSGNAREGERLYRENCQACHGAEGRGGPNDPLAGGEGSLDSVRPIKTIGSYWPYATTVFDYVRRAMPYPSPGALTDDELYSVTAYLLHLNGLVGRDDVIDAATLPTIEMPNAGGFVRGFETRP